MTTSQFTTLFGLLDTALQTAGFAKGKFSDIKGDGALYHDSGYVIVPASLMTKEMSAEKCSRFELRLKVQLAWSASPSTWGTLMPTATAAAVDAQVALNGIDWSSALNPVTVGSTIAPEEGAFELLPEGVLYYTFELPITFRRLRTT
jgi:hypothetical protein